MSGDIHNSGILTTGGSTTNIGQLAWDAGAEITNVQAASPNHSRSLSRRRGIGVVAIKAVETKAVIDVFGLTRDRKPRSGQDFYTGTVESADGRVELVAARTLETGQRSTMSTLHNLCTHRNPALIVLVGVGGGIHDRIAIGDVVVATRAIYYDQRRETADGERRRGEERHAPAAVTRAVNAFLTDYGDPAPLDSGAGSFNVRTGPIGSGEAVIMDANSRIRKYLAAFNEKALAVDMEAGGLTQFCHETPQPPGWLVVRGISDLADQAKIYDPQPTAAHHAAVALRHLIPYLPTEVVP